MTLEKVSLEGCEFRSLKGKITEEITEERLRNGILNEVRQDAFEKIRFADDEDAGLLIDAALYIIALAKPVREEGILYLEYFIEDLPELLQHLIRMVVDYYAPEEFAEIATNDYWGRDPQGIQAMISYIYIRGARYLQEGYSPDALKKALETLFPLNWRQEYREKCEKMEITDILPKYGSI